MSKQKLQQFEDKQKQAYYKILLERMDIMLSQRVYRLKEKKLDYLRNVCDPAAEYEQKTVTLDRLIETDFLFFGAGGSNKVEQEIYAIKQACKQVELTLRNN